MLNDLITGLQLSVMGMGITFLALGLLILVMILLLKVFPDYPGNEKVEVKPRQQATDDSSAQAEELAAALAVGICLLEQEGALTPKDPSLGKLLE